MCLYMLFFLLGFKHVHNKSNFDYLAYLQLKGEKIKYDML